MHGGTRKAYPVRELGQAEALRLAVERTENLADARDDLDAALPIRRTRNRCLRICHNLSLLDRPARQPDHVAVVQAAARPEPTDSRHAA